MNTNYFHGGNGSIKKRSKGKPISFGVGGCPSAPAGSSPNIRRSAVNKSVDSKPNTQTMFFNASVVSK